MLTSLVSKYNYWKMAAVVRIINIPLERKWHFVAISLINAKSKTIIVSPESIRFLFGEFFVRKRSSKMAFLWSEIEVTRQKTLNKPIILNLVQDNKPFM